MKNTESFWQKQWLLPFFFTLVYVSLPTANSTSDAFDYAGNIRWSEDLFLPHHLLYNVTGWLIFRLAIFSGLHPDVLPMMKIINALTAGLCLFVLEKNLQISGLPVFTRRFFIAFAGSSFAVMRFATENEVYLLPIFFSLAASYYFTLFKKTSSIGNVWICGILAAIACLYHQIHFFWWLGLFAGLFMFARGRRVKVSLAYLLPALIVPLAYILVMLANHEVVDPETLMQFVLKDFYTGSAKAEIGLNNLVLTGVNLVRTLFQVHGSLIFLFKKDLVYILPGCISFVLLVVAGIPLFRKSAISVKFPEFDFTHFLIFILQLAFAFFSVGNAEFMVMLPFLIALIFSPNLFYTLGKRAFLFPVAIFIWNLFYGLIPAKIYDFSGHGQLAQIVKQHPEDIFIIERVHSLSNLMYYQSGSYPINVCAPPSYYFQRKISFAELDSLIHKSLKERRIIFTDCAGYTLAFSRSGFFDTDANAKFFSKYSLSEGLSYSNFYGLKHLYKVSLK